MGYYSFDEGEGLRLGTFGGSACRMAVVKTDKANVLGVHEGNSSFRPSTGARICAIHYMPRDIFGV